MTQSPLGWHRGDLFTDAAEQRGSTGYWYHRDGLGWPACLPNACIAVLEPWLHCSLEHA